MQVKVVEGSSAFVKGDTLEAVVKANSSLGIETDITINQSIVDNSALLDFTYVEVNSNQIDLVVSNVEKIADITNSKSDSVSNALDIIRENQSLYPQMGSVLSKLDTLATASDVAKAVNTMKPLTSFLNTSKQITNSVSNIILNKQKDFRSGLNSGDELVTDDNRVWVKTFGSLGEQRNKDSIAGFDIKTYGLGIGYDKEYKEDQIIGLAAFYTNADVETNGVNHNNDVDAYTLALYGSNLLNDEKTTIYYQASHTWQKNDSNRGVFTGENANAKFTSKTFVLDLKVGHKIDINKDISVEPNIGTTYRHFTNPSYKESGAGALSLQSDRYSASQLLGNIGADFEYKVNANSTLTANLGIGYDFKDENNTVTSSFAGATGVMFESEGIDNGRWTYQAGIGYNIDLDNRNNLHINYDYQCEGSKYSNNVVSLNYMFKF
jgi:outer membrane autotransporter protein